MSCRRAALDNNGCVERVNRTVREEFYSQYQGEVDLVPVN